MPNAETARLIASLELKDQFSSKLGAAEKALGSFDSRLGRTEGRAFKAGQQIGTGIKRGAVIAAGAIGFLATNIGIGLRSLEELESQTAQTNAVLLSTKSAAGLNAEAIRNLAEKYESLNATIDDKVIQSGENLLLTFTNIRKNAFEPTLQAALDMNQAMGGGEAGLQSTIQRLGKALNDPIKGLTALGRVGVTFTKTQKEQITAAVKAGDTFKAQGIILGELNKRFGGSFLAGGDTTRGKIAKFQDSIEDLQKALATALLPTIGKVADGLSKFLADPAVVRGAEDLGKSIAGLFSDSNLKAGGDFLKGAFQTAKEAAPVVASSARATFALVQGAVGLFKSLPPEIQKLAVGAFAVNKLTGGLVTNIAGGIIDTVGKQFLQRGGTPANPLFVSDVAGLAGKVAGGAGTLAGGGLLAIGKTLLTTVAIPAVIGAFIAGQFGVGPLSPNAGKQSNVIKGLNPAAAGGRNVIAQISNLKAITDAITKSGVSLVKKIGETTLAVRASTKALRDARGAKDVAAAVKNAMTTIFTKGLGGSGGATNILNALKTQLKNTHDPGLQRVLRSAIDRVEHKIASRKIVEAQLAKADQIFRSNKTNAQKVDALKEVQRRIGNRNAIATERVQAKIDAARRAQVQAQNRTTATLKSKDFSVAVNNTIKVIATLTQRSTSTAQAISNRYYNVPS